MFFTKKKQVEPSESCLGSPAVQAVDGPIPRTPRARQRAVHVGPRELGREGSGGAAEGTHQLAATVTVWTVATGFELLLQLGDRDSAVETMEGSRRVVEKTAGQDARHWNALWFRG